MMIKEDDKSEATQNFSLPIFNNVEKKAEGDFEDEFRDVDPEDVENNEDDDIDEDDDDDEDFDPTKIG